MSSEELKQSPHYPHHYDVLFPKLCRVLEDLNRVSKSQLFKIQSPKRHFYGTPTFIDQPCSVAETIGSVFRVQNENMRAV